MLDTSKIVLSSAFTLSVFALCGSVFGQTSQANVRGDFRLLSGNGFPTEFRTIDGSENNLTHGTWGRAETRLKRRSQPAYRDGDAMPSGGNRPSAREISNVVADQANSMPASAAVTDFVWQWGQFIDHDIDLTEGEHPVEPMDIEVPTGDPWFDPQGTGTAVIEFTRSTYDHGSSPRQQMNQITAFLDGSMVYGSDLVRARALVRDDIGGLLRTSPGNLLPFNTPGLPNAGGTSPSLFLAGDVRANEQIGLAAMHTLFVREHNLIANHLRNTNPSMSAADVYQIARAIVGAEIQVITYKEFLPVLLGPGAIAPYAGYRSDLDPGIANEFSTALYRFGHSMLSPTLQRLDAAGNDIAEGPIALRDAFFAPDRITNEGGIEPILRGLASQRPQEIDVHIVDEVRNFLFGPPGAGGFDLASLNIQRGRDHGLGSYNDLRAAYGLPIATDFGQVTSDPELRAALAVVYRSPGNMDAWVGGLAEDHVPGALVGELVRAGLADQFTRLRDGDRYWYQRHLSGSVLEFVERQTLARIIRRNTSIGTELQDDVFRQ